MLNYVPTSFMPCQNDTSCLVWELIAGNSSQKAGFRRFKRIYLL